MEARRLAGSVLVCAGLLGAAASLQAQDLTVVGGDEPAAGAARFGGKGAMPISPTTVLHFNLEPGDSGGAVLAYVVAIRGAPGWYQQPTQWGAGPAEPGFDVEAWSVGSVRYTIAYSPAQRRLRTFGRAVDLHTSPVVFVTLDASGAESATVAVGPALHFVMAKPGGFGARFLEAAPAVRQFAGLE